MEITVIIPDQVAEQAELYGLTPESYVEKLVANQVVPPKPQLTKAERRTNLEKFFADISANSEKLPVLSEEAFTRASFYRDHD